MRLSCSTSACKPRLHVERALAHRPKGRQVGALVTGVVAVEAEQATRQVAVTQQNRGRQKPGCAPVAVGKRVDLGDRVVPDPSEDRWRELLQSRLATGVPMEEAFHALPDFAGRRSFVNDAAERVRYDGPTVAPSTLVVGLEVGILPTDARPR